MLTTRCLGRNETFSPTASNYGFDGATRGHGSRVVTTLGTLLVDRRFPQDKICKSLHKSHISEFLLKTFFRSRFLALPEARSEDESSFGAEGGHLGSFR